MGRGVWHLGEFWCVHWKRMDAGGLSLLEMAVLPRCALHEKRGGGGGGSKGHKTSTSHLYASLTIAPFPLLVLNNLPPPPHKLPQPRFSTGGIHNVLGHLVRAVLRGRETVGFRVVAIHEAEFRLPLYFFFFEVFFAVGILFFFFFFVVGGGGGGLCCCCWWWR